MVLKKHTYSTISGKGTQQFDILKMWQVNTLNNMKDTKENTKSVPLGLSWMSVHSTDSLYTGFFQKKPK